MGSCRDGRQKIAATHYPSNRDTFNQDFRFGS